MRTARRLLLVSILALAGAARAAEESDVPWTPGPGRVDVGRNIAQLSLADDQMFADGDATQRMMKAMGNPVSGHEVGIVASRAEGRDWFLVFEYHPIGYVRDDEKDHIDAAALLDAIRRGTDQANAERKEMGLPALHVIGWSEQPHYDPETHNLEWAVLGNSDEGDRFVNHNIRLLGRSGFMSVTLVDEPARIAASRTEVNALLDGFAYKPGRRYAEFVPGDRVAQIGLAALVAGGAGAAAAKFGLFAGLGKVLAKGFKVIVLAVVALVGAIRRFLARVFRREETVTLPSQSV